jgi:molecular chaperone GrpE
MSTEQQNSTINEIDKEVNDIMNDNVAETPETNVEMTEVDLTVKHEQEIADWKDKHMRLLAEFDNYKKRSFKEKMDTIQTAGREVIQSMIEVLDDIERAEKTMETSDDVNIVKDGVRLVFSKMRKTLEAKGLTSFDSKGKLFDVELHEAVTEIEAGKANAGKVVDELQKGYNLNEKLIRHARVVVGKSAE